MHNLEVAGVILGLVLFGAGLGLLAVACLVMPGRLEREGDEAYDEGWDDAVADRLRADADTMILRLGPPEFGQTVMLDGFDSRSAGWGEISAGPQPQPPPSGTLVHDFLHPDWEQLAPGNIDLPGVAQPVPAVQNHAGELHQDEYDRPLPTFLHLGAEYTGDDKWRARMTWRGWDQVARHEAARARLALECGIRFVPMDELEAA